MSVSASDSSSPILNKEIIARREKLLQLRKKGIAFPNDFRRDAISNQLHAQYGPKSKEELEQINSEFCLAGRMMTRRIIGKATFITIQDVGGKIQLYVSQEDLPGGQYHEILKWDLGDIIGVRGTLFKTRTGELSVYCIEMHLLTKAIRPLPDKFHGITDQEIRYRQRYLDLIVNERSRQTFKIRSRIMTEIRSFMMRHEFMEVETSMIQTLPGGAIARPFIIHHNALNLDMYLRISPELYLKQLVLGGFERVFEINRNFRNEGLSSRHHPEFTMMELYMAYADYHDLIVLMEDLLRTLVQRVLGGNIVTYGDQLFDLEKPFSKMTMKEAIFRYRPEIKSDHLDDLSKATLIAQSIGINVEKRWGLGRVQTEIFESVVEKNLIQPTFITAYPTEVSPLARCNDDNPFFADRFEFFMSGREIGNGFSELNDPEEQEARFLEQMKAKNAGDNETMLYDDHYITALEHGLPPTAGLGIGIDRLIMLFTNSKTIRDVILFPVLRPQKFERASPVSIE